MASSRITILVVLCSIVINVVSGVPANANPRCDFSVNPNNKREFKPNSVLSPYQTCPEYFYFCLKTCTCIRDPDAPPIDCEDDCFVYLKFDGDIADSSCTNAYTLQVKGQTTFETSPFGQAGVFAGKDSVGLPIFRNMFLGNSTTQFSVSFFFKTELNYPSILFDNRDENGDMSLILGYLPDRVTLVAYVKVSGDKRWEGVIAVYLKLDTPPTAFTHIAYVYNNGYLSLTSDGSNTAKVRLDHAIDGEAYTIRNMNEALSIGGRKKDPDTFIGAIDEFKVFKHALSESEIMDLYENSAY